MKHIEYKQIGNEVVRVTITLKNESNGYNEFSLSIDRFDRHRSSEPKIQFNKNVWWLHSCGCGDDSFEELFPHLSIFKTLDDKDLFGMPSYPIMNTMYYLNNDSFETGCKNISVSAEVGNQIKLYTEFHFGEFLKKHIDEVTKPLADKGIKLLEELTGDKFTHNETISGQLFNDLHYTLISDKKGWNIYKDVENKTELTYNHISNFKHLKDV